MNGLNLETIFQQNSNKWNKTIYFCRMSLGRRLNKIYTKEERELRRKDGYHTFPQLLFKEIYKKDVKALRSIKWNSSPEGRNMW